MKENLLTKLKWVDTGVLETIYIFIVTAGLKKINFFWVWRQKWMKDKKIGLTVYGKQGSTKS